MGLGIWFKEQMSGPRCIKNCFPWVHLHLSATEVKKTELFGTCPMTCAQAGTIPHPPPLSISIFFSEATTGNLWLVELAPIFNRMGQGETQHDPAGKEKVVAIFVLLALLLGKKRSRVEDIAFGLSVWHYPQWDLLLNEHGYNCAVRIIRQNGGKGWSARSHLEHLFRGAPGVQLAQPII